jgi:hypothetical protein
MGGEIRWWNEIGDWGGWVMAEVGGYDGDLRRVFGDLDCCGSFCSESSSLIENVATKLIEILAFQNKKTKLWWLYSRTKEAKAQF